MLFYLDWLINRIFLCIIVPSVLAKPLDNAQIVRGVFVYVTIKNNLVLKNVLVNFLRGYLRFARFLTLMTAKAINGHEFSVNPSISTPHELVQLIKTRDMVIISRCSKLFYTVSRCCFHIESTFSGASVSFFLCHIGRFVSFVPPVVRDMNHRRRNQLHSDNALSM